MNAEAACIDRRMRQVFRLQAGRMQCHNPFSRFPSSTLLPFFGGVPLLKPNSRKKGTLIIKGLLGNLVFEGLLKAPTQLLGHSEDAGSVQPSGHPPTCWVIFGTDHIGRQRAVADDAGWGHPTEHIKCGLASCSANDISRKNISANYGQGKKQAGKVVARPCHMSYRL